MSVQQDSYVHPWKWTSWKEMMVKVFIVCPRSRIVESVFLCCCTLLFFFLLNFIVSIIMWNKSGSVENLLRTCRSFVYTLWIINQLPLSVNGMLWWTQRTFLSHSLKRFLPIILISTFKVHRLLRFEFEKKEVTLID